MCVCVCLESRTGVVAVADGFCSTRGTRVYACVRACVCAQAIDFTKNKKKNTNREVQVLSTMLEHYPIPPYAHGGPRQCHFSRGRHSHGKTQSTRGTAQRKHKQAIQELGAT